jgi:hypothetical protein
MIPRYNFVVLNGTLPPKTDLDFNALVDEVHQQSGSPQATLINWLPLPKGQVPLTHPGTKSLLFVSFVMKSGGKSAEFSGVVRDRAAPQTSADVTNLYDTMRVPGRVVIINWIELPN